MQPRAACIVPLVTLASTRLVSRSLALPCLASIVLAAGCVDAPPPSPALEPPEILEVTAPSPVLEGSVLEVRALGLETLRSTPQLRVESAGATLDTLAPLPSELAGTLRFETSRAMLDALGEGPRELVVRLVGERDSLPFAVRVDVARSLSVELVEVPSGNVLRNEVAVVRGAGMLTGGEGTVRARFLGTYSGDGVAGDVAIDVALPVVPLELHDRERGVVVLSTDLGGLSTGTFRGSIRLESELRDGSRTESAALETTLSFGPPAVFAVTPAEASLGQLVTVRGGGFLGGAERPNETTLLRIEGTFTPAEGGAAERFGPVELVPRFVSGAEVELAIELELRGGQLVSSLFGHARGELVGTATPIALAGNGASARELRGDPAPLRLALGPLRQVVYLRFLPGFYESLRRFGLSSAAPEVAESVLARMQDLYADWSVDLRLEEPDEFDRSAYSVVELGGADPTGAGLFGYDNTPGKDVGNLRLFDALGGANAQTQADGFPGYGGVFVESFLYWSSHPDLPGERPPSAPSEDPLFDEVFDPVRLVPATRAEVRGVGSAERVASVRAAIDALGAIIGETASHELGHSLGLAQPYGSPTAFHNDFDGEGCLMDRGGDRPLGERMGRGGFTPSHFCYDAPDYLTEILGR